MPFYGHRCVYKGCNNVSYKDKLTFFKFPIGGKIRASEWIKNSGNIVLVNLEKDKLKNKRLCEVHFSFEDIIINNKRKMLKKTAVPIMYEPKKSVIHKCESIQKPIYTQKVPLVSQSEPGCSKWKCYPPATRGVKRDARVLSSSSGNSDDSISRKPKLPYINTSESDVSERILNMPSNKLSWSPRSKKLRLKVCSLQKKATKITNFRLKRNTNSFRTLNVVENVLYNKSDFVKTFVKMQMFHGKRDSWTTKEKKLALSIYYKSPSAYKFLVYNLKFVLPAIRTIQTWLKIYNLGTGVNTQLISKLRERVATMNKWEKECTVLMDEINVKVGEQYNEHMDRVEGIKDLGELGREDKPATTVLAFYVRGLLKNWKLPFCYYASNGPVKSDNLVQLIKIVLKKIIEISLNPRVLVCDQGANNRRAFNILGCTKKTPMFFIENKKILTIYDPPHLLKSIRNNFMNTKVQILIDGEKVSWCDLVNTYEEDCKSKTTRLLPKITNNQIKPTNFQKMRVKLASQVFSHSMACAIRTANTLNVIKTAAGPQTANFIDNINKIFDALNSRNLLDSNPQRRPLSIKNNMNLNILKNAILYFEKIEVYSKSVGDKIGKKRNNIYCLEGFQWTINSVLLLWDDLIKEIKDFKFLFTSYLNQDPLQFFFSVVRSRGGYNSYPTVSQFRIAMSHNMFIRLSNESNCEEDLAEYLDLEETVDRSCHVNPLEIASHDSDIHLINTELEYDEKGVEMEIATLDNSNLTLELCSNTYVAGYLANKLVLKHKCDICKTLLTKNENDPFNDAELQIFYKDYGVTVKEKITYLKRPSDDYNRLISKLLLSFIELYKQHKCSTKIKEIVLPQLKKLTDTYINENMPQWHCSKHIEFLINNLFNMMIRRYLKFESEQIQLKLKEKTKSAGKKTRKLLSV